MNIELPKDAEGREIPLDTVVMFGGNGNAYNIVRWSYITKLNAGDENANSWYAVTKGRTVLDPELMYLTPSDSWEKLEEDLGRVASCGKNGTPVCAYTRQPCAVCKFHSSEDCTSAMCADIVSRIRKLRGKD